MMQKDFNSNYLVDRYTDESLVDNVFPEHIVDLFYQDDVQKHFIDNAIDFGGGVYGITCRAVLFACDSDPEILCELLNLRKKQDNRSLCSSIIATCKQQINSSAYLL